MISWKYQRQEPANLFLVKQAMFLVVAFRRTSTPDRPSVSDVDATEKAHAPCTLMPRGAVLIDLNKLVGFWERKPSMKTIIPGRRFKLVTQTTPEHAFQTYRHVYYRWCSG